MRKARKQKQERATRVVRLAVVGLGPPLQQISVGALCAWCFVGRIGTRLTNMQGAYMQ